MVTGNARRLPVARVRAAALDCAGRFPHRDSPEAAVAKDLYDVPQHVRERAHIGSMEEYQRLYRYLLNQGFDPDRIARALNARRKK